MFTPENDKRHIRCKETCVMNFIKLFQDFRDEVRGPETWPPAPFRPPVCDTPASQASRRWQHGARPAGEEPDPEKYCV